MIDMPRTVVLMRNDVVYRCIDACKDCHSVCVETIIHCQNMGGKHAETPHIWLMRDCTDIYKESEGFILRGSEFMNQVCSICADICGRCVESCEAFDDQAMKTCTQSCPDCSSSCREMVGTA